MGRVSGEFLWFPFEKLSVLPEHSVKTMYDIVRRVIKSRVVLNEKPLACKESLTSSIVFFSLSSSCSDVTRTSFSVRLAKEPKDR